MNEKVNSINELYELYIKELISRVYTIKASNKTINGTEIPSLPKKLMIKFPKNRFPHMVGLQHIYSIQAKLHIENLDNNKNDFLYKRKKLQSNPNFNTIANKIKYFDDIVNIMDNSKIYYVPSGKITANIPSDFLIVKKLQNAEINLGLIWDSKSNSLYPRTFLINDTPSKYNKFINSAELIDINSITEHNNVLQTKTTIYLKNNTKDDIERDLLKFKLKNVPTGIINSIQNYNLEKGMVFSISAISKAYIKDKKNIIKNPLLQSIGRYFETNQQNKYVTNVNKHIENTTKSEVASTVEKKAHEIE